MTQTKNIVIIGGGIFTLNLVPKIEKFSKDYKIIVIEEQEFYHISNNGNSRFYPPFFSTRGGATLDTVRIGIGVGG